jgi:hypothetical protein
LGGFRFHRYPYRWVGFSFSHSLGNPDTQVKAAYQTIKIQLGSPYFGIQHSLFDILRFNAGLYPEPGPKKPGCFTPAIGFAFHCLHG